MWFTHEFTEPSAQFDIVNSVLSLDTWHSNVIQFCLVFSSFCLILSFAVYSLVPELRSLPGKCLMGLIVSQFITNLLLICALNFPSRTMECFITGVFLHYFSLTMMYWANMIGYDLLQKLWYPAMKRNSHFKRYVAVVYLVAALLVALPLFFELYLPKIRILKPEYGKITCGINSWTAKVFYVTVPIVFSVFFNLVVFFYAVFRLRSFAAELHHLEILVPPLSRRLVYFGKLSLLFGFSGMFGYLGYQLHCCPHVKFAIFLYNSLHGCYIFVAFTCKRSTLRKLRKQIRTWRLATSTTMITRSKTMVDCRGNSSIGIPSKNASCKF